MKIGSFEHTDLVIDKTRNLLIHKPSGIFVDFKKADKEEENIKRFANALHMLGIRVGLWLIDQL